jgi:ClpP class serine protease
MWLIKKDIADAMQHARAQGFTPPKAAMEAFETRHAEASAAGIPRNFKLAGDVVEIAIEGVLTPKPDFFAFWYGGGNTTYPDIIQSLALAAADPSVKRVVLNVRSPGGYCDGLFEALGALEAFPKPKETRASMADSAAYAIAAMGGKITAAGPASEFGSVGVVATYVQYDFEKVYEITSTHAPDKRPDPSTPEGQATIRVYLDALHDLFVDAIARGRTASGTATTKDEVNSDFGRGGVLLANSAKRLGMIDKIDKPQLRAVASDPEPRGEALASPAAAEAAAPAATTTPAPPAPQTNAPAANGGAPNRKQKTMDEKQLQAEHPALYSAVFNKGKAEGKTEAETAAAAALAEEKDRIEAHLVMGETTGDMKLAVESIRKGDKMTQTLSAKYMVAGMSMRALSARADDDKAAAVATDGAAGGKPAKTLRDQIADEIEAQTKGGAAA